MNQNQASIPWETQMSCILWRVTFSSLYSRSFSPISSFTSLSLSISLFWCSSSSPLSLTSLSFCSSTRFSLSWRASSKEWFTLSSSSLLTSLDSSLYFIIDMCYSRFVKLSVRAVSFYCRHFSAISEFLSWVSSELMALDFSASISSKTWISASI